MQTPSQLLLNISNGIAHGYLIPKFQNLQSLFHPFTPACQLAHRGTPEKVQGPAYSLAQKTTFVTPHASRSAQVPGPGRVFIGAQLNQLLPAGCAAGALDPPLSGSHPSLWITGPVHASDSLTASRERMLSCTSQDRHRMLTALAIPVSSLIH